MNGKHIDLSNLGLSLQEYVKLGLNQIANSPCILCKHAAPNKPGMLIAADPKSEKAIGTQPGQQRLVFYCVCEQCSHDPQMKQKVAKEILLWILGQKQQQLAVRQQKLIQEAEALKSLTQQVVVFDPQSAQAAQRVIAQPQQQPPVVNHPKVIQNDGEQYTVQF